MSLSDGLIYYILCYMDDLTKILYLNRSLHKIVMRWIYDNRIIDVRRYPQQAWFCRKINNVSYTTLISKHNKYIEFDDRFDYPIDLQLSKLRHIQMVKFGCCFDSSIVVSRQIYTLIFGNSFNQPIDLASAWNLHTLIFGNAFNQPVDFRSMGNLHTLIFGRRFNQLINPRSMGNLHTVKFGWDFNQPVDFPESVYSIEFGWAFNYSVDFQSTKELHTVIFGDSFNCVVDFQSTKVHTVKFGYHFNQPIDLQSTNLHVVEFGASFNQLVDFQSTKIHTIKFGLFFNRCINHVSANIKTLIFHRDYTRFQLAPDEMKTFTETTDEIHRTFTRIDY